MARKKTAEELRDDARKLRERAKHVEEKESAEIGNVILKFAKQTGKTPEELIEILKSQLSTTFPQVKDATDKTEQPNGQ